MNISAINNQNKNYSQQPAFAGKSGAGKSFAERSQELLKRRKDLEKQLKEASKDKNTSVEKFQKIEQDFKDLKKDADELDAEKTKDSDFGKKVDNVLEKYFKGFIKFGKKLIGDNKDIKIDELINKVTRFVLLGNVGKEVVGTILYTTQAMTNEDLPKEKRKFVGMYDLFVGIVSTTVSFIFGVGLQNSIKKGYKNAFKPAEHLAKTTVIASAAAAFTSFALQTIVGKRIIAPAIATPIAGRVKKNMMEKDEAKKAAQTQALAENKPEKDSETAEVAAEA